MEDAGAAATADLDDEEDEDPCEEMSLPLESRLHSSERERRSRILPRDIYMYPNTFIGQVWPPVGTITNHSVYVYARNVVLMIVFV